MTDTARESLHRGGVIAHDIIDARGYATLGRGLETAELLRRLSFPGWVVRAADTSAMIGALLIPTWGPSGQRTGYQVRFGTPVKGPAGKPMRYSGLKGQTSPLDVHPSMAAAMADPTVDLWITEGVKKADALTSAGKATIALAGVFGWRSTMGTLGAWEEVPLKGRRVTIVFDHDAGVNPNIARAMKRLGLWLKSRGARGVRYIVTPAVPHHLTGEPDPKTGVDDYLADGGTLDALVSEWSSLTPPVVEDPNVELTDAVIVEALADDVLDGSWAWSPAHGWLQWTGTVWQPSVDELLVEEARQWLRGMVAHEIANGAGATRVQTLTRLLSKGKPSGLVELARGLAYVDPATLDADPDVLNTPSGLVDLTTGEVRDHDPNAWCTRITSAPYVPGADEHPDWQAALEAVPADVRDWLAMRVGQAVSGHMTPDDTLAVWQGGGSNGKSTLLDALRRAVGGYGVLLGHRALLGGSDAHPTELMDLQGARFAVMEELPEGRHLDVVRLKMTIGTPEITARRIARDSVTFRCTHSLTIATNYRPEVHEVDDGTWRRLLLVSFPYTFRAPHEPLRDDNDRRGDPDLRARLGRTDTGGTAALAWAVRGAVDLAAWRAAHRGCVMPPPPSRVLADTAAWRGDHDTLASFWSECMTPDPDGVVWSGDLVAALGEYLRARGLSSWSDRTLGTRMAGHPVSRGLTPVYVRSRHNLSRPRGVFTEPPGRFRGWQGVRFATAADVEAETFAEGLETVTTPSDLQ